MTLPKYISEQFLFLNMTIFIPEQEIRICNKGTLQQNFSPRADLLVYFVIYDNLALIYALQFISNTVGMAVL